MYRFLLGVLYYNYKIDKIADNILEKCLISGVKRKRLDSED